MSVPSGGKGGGLKVTLTAFDTGFVALAVINAMAAEGG